MSVNVRDATDNSGNNNHPAAAIGTLTTVGDIIFLFLDAGTAALTTTPSGSGWTALPPVSPQSSTSFVWWKTAVVGDAGLTVNASLTSSTKWVFQTVTLSGAGAPIAYSSAVETSDASSHVSPTVTFTGTAAVLNHVYDKASPVGTLWTVPTGFTNINDTYLTGSGSLSAVTALSSSSTVTSPAGGDTYTQNASGAQSGKWTIIVPTGTAPAPDDEWSYDFDGGTDATAIPIGAGIMASTAAYYTTSAIHGSSAAYFPDSSGSLRIQNQGTATHSGSIYLRPGTDPGSASARVVAFQTESNVLIMSVRLHGGGLIEIADPDGNKKDSTSDVSWFPGQKLRLDWQYDGTDDSAPALTVRVHSTDPEGTNPNATLTWTADAPAGPMWGWQLGYRSGGGAFSGVLDTFRAAQGLFWLTPFDVSHSSAGAVIYALLGAPTSSGFAVNTKTVSCTSLRLVVCTNAAMTQQVKITEPVVPDAGGRNTFTVTDLAPAGRYYYALQDTPGSGVPTLIGSVGRARTAPLPGTPGSFRFAFGACVETNATQPAALDDLRNWDPSFAIFTGDLHYHDPTSTDPAVHAGFLETQITSAAGMKDMLASVPMFYARSDHDAGPGDNADSDVPSNQASIDAYKQIMPLPPLADTRDPTVGLYYSWVWGRVRFILLDIRNMDRSPGLDGMTAAKTMLGATQKQWLFDRLSDIEPVKVIISDVPWPGPPSTANGQDKWWSYPDERQEIADFITDRAINVILLSGDSHSLMCDDGSHNSWGGFSIYSAAPFFQEGGGRNLNYYDQVYNVGTSTHAAQYGRVIVTDDGSTITFTFSGWDALTGTEKIGQTDVFSASGTGTPIGVLRRYNGSSWELATVVTAGDQTTLSPVSLAVSSTVVGTGDPSVTRLTQLSDVDAGSPGDGQILTWDSATSKWVPVTVPGLSDVVSLATAQTVTGPKTFDTSTVGDTRLTVRANAIGQTADIFQAYSGTDTGQGNQRQRTTYLNEKGELRVIAAKSNSVGVRIKGQSGQSVNITEWTDLANNAMSWVGPSGEVRAPNLGHTLTWALPGTATVGAVPTRLRNLTGTALTVRAVSIQVGTAPTGSPGIVVDFLISGVSIFANPVNRPSIGSGATESSVVTVTGVTWPAGAFLTMQVISVGSGSAGSNLAGEILAS